MAQKKGKEARGSERVSMRLSLSLYLDKQQSSPAKQQRATTSCYLVDLSDTGMRICSDMLLETDRVVAATILFEREARRLPCKFRVKWLTKNSYRAFGAYSYGLELTEISEADRRFLARLFQREKDNSSQKTINKG